MNCIAYESVGIVEFSSEDKAQAKTLRLNAARRGQARLGDQVARRVAEVVDSELAQGALPA